MSGFAARLRELSVAATPGPWATEYSPEAEGGLWVHAILQLGHPRHYIADPVQLPDASLIVTLRNHAEEIAAVIEAAEHIRERRYQGSRVAFDDIGRRMVIPWVQDIDWAAFDAALTALGETT